MKNPFRSVTLACALLAVAAASAEEVNVIKTAASGNPGLCLVDYQGPAAGQARLLKVLTQSDWFTVLPTSGGAKYRLKARYSPGVIDLELAAGAGMPVRIRQTSSRPEWAIYKGVDALIEKVFRNPGPCASSIAFVNGTGTRKEIFTCLFDGTGARAVTTNQSISTEPSWGPRGTLVYTLYQGCFTDVVLADLVNRRQRRISEFPGLNASADLSPDGSQVAICLSRDRTVDLYVMGVQTKALRRLTRDAAVEASPCWSPDGRTICFVSDRAGKPGLYLISAGGGTARRLLGSSAETVSPSWSPVSNKICFATRAFTGEYGIGMLDMAKGGRTPQPVATNARWEAPSWAPDGRHVVAARKNGGSRDLCIVDTQFGTILPITRAGPYSLPSWSPAQ
ncbi:MAG: hypothetical protein WC708_01685 [Lentisphaeria bacterium]